MINEVGEIMRIHALINYSVADLGTINEWIQLRGHQVTTTNVFASVDFPDVADFDLLIILGGVMGAYEEDKHPWLKDEKQFILEAIHHDKAVLGICLGSQMIANVLGGEVFPHKHEEIGWWRVTFNEQVEQLKVFEGLKRELHLFQYHGDTFTLPDGSLRLASSEATENQAFIYKDRVVGLQFHPEFSEAKLQEIVALHGDKIQSGPYVQMPDEFLGRHEYLREAKEFLFKLLDNFEKIVKNS